MSNGNHGIEPLPPLPPLPPEMARVFQSPGNGARDDTGEEWEEMHPRPPYPTVLDHFLKDKDSSYRLKVWEIISQFNIPHDDPVFVMLASCGRLEILLERSPKELNAMFQLWEQQITESLDLKQRAAVKVTQAAIAMSVQDLIRKAEWEKATQSWPALIKAGSLLLLAAGAGALFGFGMFAWRQSRVEYVGAARQLTVTEASALQWAMSKEGKFAKDLLTWNQYQFSRNGGQLQCVRDAQALNVTLRVEGRDATDGFCTVWVKPPQDRRFKQPK